MVGGLSTLAMAADGVIKQDSTEVQQDRQDLNKDKQDVQTAKENVAKDKTSGDKVALKKDRQALREARRNRKQEKARLETDKGEKAHAQKIRDLNLQSHFACRACDTDWQMMSADLIWLQ